MRVCMVGYTFYEFDNRVRRYAETLAKRGDQVDVIALRRQGQSPEEVINGVHVFRIQERIVNETAKLSYLLRSLLFFFRSMLFLITRQLRSPYALIHLHTPPDFEVFAAWFPKLMGAKIILDIHDLLPEFYASKFNTSLDSPICKLLTAIEKVSAAFADHVVAANHIWQRKLVARSVKLHNCTTILNFPDQSIFGPRERSRTNHRFVILYPGSLSYHQGVDIAIRAFALIKNRVPCAEFHIYGAGDQQASLRCLIAELGLEDRVFLKQPVPLTEVSALMQTADLGVVPKRSESFGNQAFSTKILEFMSVGVPVIVSDTEIDRSYFDDSLVKFFRSNDEKDLADSMLLLIQDGELRRRLAQNAEEFISRNHWDAKKSDYLNLVDSLTVRTSNLDNALGRQIGDTLLPRNNKGLTMSNQALIDRYRCPQHIGQFSLAGEPSPHAGYFRLGPDAICYGQCASGSPVESPADQLHDAAEGLRVDGGTLWLPLDPNQVVNNLRLERYATDSNHNGLRRIVEKAVRNAYYSLRPLMPFKLRKNLQKAYLRGRHSRPFPRWPVDCSVEDILEKLLALSMKAQGIDEVPFIWFWPDGAPGCVMMTHDVETASGLRFCHQLMDIDQAYGIRSSFQIVPEKRYAVPQNLLRCIRARGFEINVHDLCHDGRLFADRSEFLRRARSINHYGRDYGARGFRSAVLYRNLDWYQALDFSYDMSVPNVAHLDPQSGGCCTVFPYFIGEILELPVTTSQDYTLFHMLGRYSLEHWEVQIRLILEKHGLATFVTHPDYLQTGRAQQIYEDLLGYISQLRSQEVWVALPRDVDRWWRARSQMRLVAEAGGWRVEGPQSERARVAYARVENGQLVYSFAGKMQPITTTIPKTDGQASSAQSA